MRTTVTFCTLSCLCLMTVGFLFNVTRQRAAKEPGRQVVTLVITNETGQDVTLRIPFSDFTGTAFLNPQPQQKG